MAVRDTQESLKVLPEISSKTEAIESETTRLISEIFDNRVSNTVFKEIELAEDGYNPLDLENLS